MEYRSPGKGQIRETSGRMLGHLARRESRGSLGTALGKSENPPEKGSIDPAGRLMEPEQESTAGNRVPNVLPGCCLLP
ncbi:hypothetical protein CesoFtcFv8_006663 [Champsocephalus esox]|uniref:Uncharacterized protein n=2 Tax=Champsocephalus TaxID=52236 RepID=A0AAN8E042_CHAGU|nr:hypothetical protein CesoFtcFv8_006663 [Champsocephalus esox]KAK5929808.1 hypothetical protein CgunFtcFv8_011010 [Champsocephalus gunnari]